MLIFLTYLYEPQRLTQMGQKNYDGHHHDSLSNNENELLCS